MESFGEILKNRREEKQLELDKISRETFIEKRFLQALEEENDSVFNGETYLKGYLKNYAVYLELDADYLLKLFQSKQLQESPLPTELYKDFNKKKLLPIILISTISVLIIATVITLICIFKKKNITPNDLLLTKSRQSQQYELTENKFTKRVYKGDQFLLPTQNDENIILTVRQTLSKFGIDTPSGTFFIELSEESEIDINGDNTPDLIIYVSDISFNDESRGAEINVILRHNKKIVDSQFVEDIPFENEIKSSHPHKVILTDNRAYPFTINISFRGSCLFRDKVDNNEPVETYFTRGELFTANPRNGIRLWISNIYTIKITIIADSKTYDLDIGTAGQVLVQDIKWIRDSDGQYKLVVIELD